MKINFSFKQKPRLAVLWQPDSIALFLFTKLGGLKHRSFRLEGSSDEVLAVKIKEFLGKPGLYQTILMIPRSEVLQKEMAISVTDGLRENLETRLTQLLPYSPKEMAYSLAIDSSDEKAPSRGLLYAIPEQKIKQVLESLVSVGIAVDDVVSEDQVLFWLFQDKTAQGPILVFDQTPERTLFLALKENAILLSREYPREETFKNVLSEVSFSLLEAGVKPVKAFVVASMEQQEIAQTFEIPLEPIQQETLEKSLIPLVFSGALRWGAYPVISLLPSGQKIQKRIEKQNRFIKEGLMAFGLFLVSFSFLCACHLFFLNQKKAMLEKEVAKLAPSVSQIRQITDSLATLHEAERSKQRLLRFLGELATHTPSSVRLKELEIGDEEIVFQGESSSHTLLTETVQVFEKIEGVKEAKLEHARLRKRLNQDYFDFEVTAKWQN